MAEVFYCRACGGPIEDPSGPDVIRTRKHTRLPLLSDRKGDDKIGYFHTLCFTGQRGWERIAKV